MSLRSRVAVLVSHAAVVAAMWTILSPAPLRAAGPLLVNGAGAPLVWNVNPIPFNPDRGPLGNLSNATAVAHVTANFGVWAAVPTSSISFVNAGALPVDVTAANWTSFLDDCTSGHYNPIIFDADGSITDAVFGLGANNSILGFAGPDCVNWTSVPPVITGAEAVLNGKFLLNAFPLSDFDAVFVHEFGHYFNLDHSQIGLEQAFDGNPSNDYAIATMFPILVDPAGMSSLHLDDQVSVSMLYPAPSFASAFGTIAGNIMRSDGVTRFQDAYVIARKVDDPLATAVGMASGFLYFPSHPGGPPPPSLKGEYELPGLPPGNYTVEIQAINAMFTGGSSVGPLDTPVPLPGPAEFWNGANEAGSNPPDDPTQSVAIPVTAASTQSGIDIIMNSFPPDSLVVAPRPISYTIAAGAIVTKTLRVAVKNANVLPVPESPGHTIQLSVSSDCPAGTVGAPDFNPPYAQDSVLVAGGKSKTATVRLTIDSAAFANLNRKAAHRCTLTFTATAPGATQPDPNTTNNQASVDLNVIVTGNAGSTRHESVINVISPVTVVIPKNIAQVRRVVRVTVGNADYLPTAESPGHAITVDAGDGDCQPGTVGMVDFDLLAFGAQNVATVKGGALRTGFLTLTVDAAKFTSPNVLSPARCTAVVRVTGPANNTEPDATNNTVHLDLDVIDRNDL